MQNLVESLHGSSAALWQVLVLLAVLCLLLAFLLLAWRVNSMIAAWLRSREPQLQLKVLNVKQPKGQRSGMASLELSNVGGSALRIKSLELSVAAHGASQKYAELSKTAPHAQSDSRLNLRSDKETYRLKPPTGDKRLLEADWAQPLQLELMSDEHHWFRVAVEAVWHDAKRRNCEKSTRSREFFLEFAQP
ncbi:hypothetical protein [Agaribacterium haliotis]|uniref:hypothetical protein n=1 Tax=Agaribacterium haliotis TaxID=2013869 RepID=UPI000BB5667C|nr:hypothetical protein [Agaribacterium haliotis]